MRRQLFSAPWNSIRRCQMLTTSSDVCIRPVAKSSNAEKELHKVQELHKKAEDNLVGKISSSPPALNPSEAR